MAKQLSEDTLKSLVSIIDNHKPLYKLTPLMAVNLALQGMLNIREDGKLIITTKACKALKRNRAALRQNSANQAVAYVVGGLLKEAQDTVQHRAVWNLVGRDLCTRDEVLNGLKALRDAGVLRSYKKSNNNFQIFWTLDQPQPEAAFSTNGDQA